VQVGVDASWREFSASRALGEDPARITAIVNSVAERYIAVATDLKKARLTEQTASARRSAGPLRNRTWDHARTRWRRFRTKRSR